MLQGLLSFIFLLSSIFLIFIILVQKGKSSLGIGTLGGGSQMLFGSSGGQDLFQKITWVLGVILIGGSLGLAVLKSRQASNFLRTAQQIPVAPLKQ
jgi:protein translocase SecG subunit